MRKNISHGKIINTFFLTLWVNAGFSFILASTGCPLLKKHEPFECSVAALKENPSTGYYDASIRVERILLKEPFKSRYSLVTPTSSFDLTNLRFIEDGNDPDQLEAGDVFIVPLNKPDWKFFIREKNEIYCYQNFWELIPEKDQWHPLKSEAMQLAQNIEVAFLSGTMKPAIGNLPEEWEKAGEKLPGYDDPCGEVDYQKKRADEIKEEVFILYCLLTEEEKLQLDIMSATDFLKGWTEWTKKAGESADVAGHNAIVWDMHGMGPYGWSFRYIYIESDLAIEVNIDADPMEWVKTPQEKRIEEKSRRVFLRYGYGPIGEPEWQIMMEIRLNGGGVFHKRSRAGISIEKEFRLSVKEIEEINRALVDNRFLELRSRSGLPGGITSFISVQYKDKPHKVEMKNVQEPLYQNIENLIKSLVLPKVDEEY